MHPQKITKFRFNHLPVSLFVVSSTGLSTLKPIVRVRTDMTFANVRDALVGILRNVRMLFKLSEQTTSIYRTLTLRVFKEHARGFIS
jgi:hypothetical protein